MRKTLLLTCILLSALTGRAQTDTIRYVDGTNGKLSNDGRSWATALKEVQDAVNDLHEYLEANNLTSGSVYVKAGTYRPTESTEQSGSGTLYTSFKIYSGIHVYGGFNATTPESRPEDRILVNHDNTQTVKIGERPAGSDISYWSFQSPTVFTGNHNTAQATTFSWDPAHYQYKTRFPGNSYHVVWFGTAGIEEDTHAPGHLKPLPHEACIDGVTIQDGNASNRLYATRRHNSYGGGVYMVEGAIIRNCIVQNCSAALRGGGVYMDGGGTMDRCLVRKCQSLGVGIVDGYGGGVAADFKGHVRQSLITQCVARIGGGAALSYYKSKTPASWHSKSEQFDPHLSSCIVVNNTSTTEAGGILLDNGGTVNHCTVSRNDNRGPDLSYNGQRYGRSGGIYVNTAGVIYNSVVAGNTCQANNNVQYGSYTGSATADHTGKTPNIWYTAFQNHDITDWSNTSRHNVFSLESQNIADHVDATGHYTMFHQPGTVAGAGITQTTRPDHWRPEAGSYLGGKGVQATENAEMNDIMQETRTSYDLLNSRFQPISALGALSTDVADIEVALVAPVDGDDTETTLPTLFIDPEYAVINTTAKRGGSWDAPLTTISRAIEHFRVNYPDQKVQILVKTGFTNTVGPSSYLTHELRTASIRPRSNMRLFGGYPAASTGTDTNGRNPVANPVRITANAINAGYGNNTAHVVVLDNVHDVIIDGFKLLYGNATNSSGLEGIPYGGGIIITNQNAGKLNETERVNQTNNQLRNCEIANCTAPDGGAAIYVAGTEYLGAINNPSTTVTEASLKVINCIIHNNTTTQPNGIVTANGRASITMDHCTVVGNAGFPLQTLSAKGYTGNITVNNSAFYANTAAEHNSYDNLRNGSAQPLMATGTTANISGDNNIVDRTVTVPATLVNTRNTLGYQPDDKTSYASFENTTRNIGARRNLDDLTVYGGEPNYTPQGMNPMVNAASAANPYAQGTDMSCTNSRTFGGAPDAGAIENESLPANGQVMYVRNTDGEDADGYGGSWGKAFKTITYALTQAKAANTATPDAVKEIWVAAGVYFENITMVEGVNVYGGFLAYGNPGKKKGERDISNLDKDYMTIIDGDRKGRVLDQGTDFTTETMWEGFTIQHGLWNEFVSETETSATPTTMTTTQETEWSMGTYGVKVKKVTVQNVVRTTKRQYSTTDPAWTYGIGVNLMKKGTIQNCLVRENLLDIRRPLQYTVQYVDSKTVTVTTTRKESPTAAETSTTETTTDLTPSRIYANIQGQWYTRYGSHNHGGAGVATTDGSQVENCVIRNNRLELNYGGARNGAGCGVRMQGGVLINSLVTENIVNGGAGTVGVALYMAKKSALYNCTVTYNQGVNINTNAGTGACAPAVWDDATRAQGNWVPNASVFYNCIIYGNVADGKTGENYTAVGRGNWQSAIGQSGFMFNCYHSVPSPYFANEGVNNDHSAVTHPELVFNAAILTETGIPNGGASSYSQAKSKEYINACTAQNLFDEHRYPFFPDGSSDNPYRIHQGSALAPYCINMGADEYGETLANTYGIDVDIAGADRVQDCQIDKGAYEYNGAASISPEMSKDAGNTDVATYYVTQNGAGVASASSPATAACMQKLQKVLDAAGRYKYDNPTHQVVVKLAAIAGGGYVPTRTAQTNGAEENPRSWSILVPHGVELWGGYPVDGQFQSRNVIDNKTLLTGAYTNDGKAVNVYHVVTFTNLVFDENDQPMKGTDGQLLDLSTRMTATDFSGDLPKEAKYVRSVLDGLFLEGGAAEGVLDENQNGGAAVVTGYAHVRNCIVQNNRAANQGGGLYLEDRAIVTGSIIQQNHADYGGGISIADHADKEVNYTTYPHIFASTVLKNTAATRGGGIYFLNNLRANSSIFWNNTSNDQGDVSGVVSKSAVQDIHNFPLSYCAVTSLRMPGVNNIEVATEPIHGVRWATTDDYYPIQVSSQLARAGMSYNVYQQMIANLPSLELTDINGVPRMEVTDADVAAALKNYDGEAMVAKDNGYIEIGARAVNYPYNIQSNKSITDANLLTRLFVAHSEDINANRATALQNSGDIIYSQIGSSFANPFLRLDDAIDYIITARNSAATVTDANNRRFEIFVDGGVFHPYTNIDREANRERNNTFLLPEGVSLIGSIDVSKDASMYCQSTTADVTVAGHTLIGKSTDAIRQEREHYDINQNSIIEPWEMKKQTELSGVSAGSESDVSNIYHVISIINDESRTGAQPTMKTAGGAATTDAAQESRTSLAHRSIMIDGVSITGGSARYYENLSVGSINGYFRGGGIHIDGNQRRTVTNAGGTYSYTEETDAMQRGTRNLPVVISNSLFIGNNAIQGGAVFSNGSLTITGCSFVQNFSSGPSGTTEQQDDDARLATYSGGGCIAANGDLEVINSLFANNEAREGQKALMPHGDVADKPHNDHAADYQGYGGVIWGGDQSSIRFVNCNLVRNLSVAYPAVFNSTANTAANTVHYGVNTLFWGNGVTSDISAQPEKTNIMNFGTDQIQSVFFSAYPEGSGLPAIRSTDPTIKQLPYSGDPSTIATTLTKDGTLYNQNIILDNDNDAIEGPNFILPSITTGVNGYMQSANWMIARVNRLADNGWGFLEQQNINFISETISGTSHGSFKGGGLYKVVADRMKTTYGLTMAPLGNEPYQNYSATGREPLYRIAKDALVSADQVYVDIGVYEYQHAILQIDNGGEIDTLWVATTENIDNGNDGTSWDRPTSDLQRAIETLMLSRNNKPKQLNIIEGTYTPIYQLNNNNQGFQILFTDNTENVLLPKTIEAGKSYGISSLTIQGGYSAAIEGERNTEQYPVVLRSSTHDIASGANQKHLFHIIDTEQRKTSQGDNSMTSRKTVPDKHAVPITFDGLTFINEQAQGNATQGGAAICYAEQFQSDNDKNKTTDKLLLPPTDNTPKLTIKNCIFQQNGKTAGVPAVTIAAGGGETIIYNSLFHSNIGNPLEAIDAKVINCTFALNGGHLKLSESGNDYEDEDTHVTTRFTSELHNSLIWKDSRANAATPTFYELISTATTPISHNAISGYPSTTEDTNHNIALGDDNGEILTGPNFVAPEHTDAALRNFHLQPAWLTISRADGRTFAEKALRLSGADLTGTALIDHLTDTIDLAGVSRYYQGGMERGAYEMTVPMNRIYYVRPDQPYNNSQDGTDWEKAYGAGKLQEAIDGAALYASINQKKAYVLVQGNSYAEDAVNLRDGVTLMGSLASRVVPNADRTPGNTPEQNAVEEDRAIEDMINQIKATRRGMAAQGNTNRTPIKGVSTSGNGTMGSLMDGFVIKNDNPQAVSPVSLDAGKSTVRNCIITSNIMDGTTPVANLSAGLLYNTLIYGNTAATAVSMNGGTMLNCTVVAAHAGEMTIANGQGKVINCLAWNKADGQPAITTGTGSWTASNDAAAGYPFTPYLSPSAGDAFAHAAGMPTVFEPYAYQLHEQSQWLNSGNDDDAVLDRTVFGTDVVDFAHDRDMLGNPRLLSNGQVDAGCFETWRIADNANVYATGATNTVADLTQPGTRIYTDNFGGNLYPHEGSVVYIGKNAKLNLNRQAADAPIFTAEAAFRPSYLLLQQGGSLYGNGNVVRVQYMALEQTYPAGTQYQLMSLPFSHFHWKNMVQTTVNANQEIVQTAYTNLASAKQYNGLKRSAWNYNFKDDNSDCWEPVAEDMPIAANQGWLLTFNAPLASEQTLRFTGWTNNTTVYVYEESSQPKTVTLRQYNTIDNSGQAHFTRAENMGWNLVGMPYLVSSYATALKENGTYTMNVPHVLYGMNAADGSYQSGGQMVTAQSWADGNTIRIGDGYFMQTAVQAATETLTFKLPVNTDTPTIPAARPYLVMTDGEGQQDRAEVIPSASNTSSLAYTLGMDGIKWTAFDENVPQLYLIDNRGTRLSLAGDAPIEQAIPIGIRTTRSGSVTISLTNADAFSISHVWLSDSKTGRIVDLKQEDYTLNVESPGYLDNRLSLQLNGVHTAMQAADLTEHRLYSKNSRVYVEGLQDGEAVSVWSLSGQLIEEGTVSTQQYVSSPLVKGVYIIRMGQTAQKLMVK